jgi:Ribbon-helix-helix protein, copG family
MAAKKKARLASVPKAPAAKQPSPEEILKAFGRKAPILTTPEKVSAFIRKRGIKPLSPEQLAALDKDIADAMKFGGGDGSSLLPAITILQRKLKMGRKTSFKTIDRLFQIGAYQAFGVSDEIHRQWLQLEDNERTLNEPLDKYETYVKWGTLPEGFTRGHFNDALTLSRLVVRSTERSYGLAGLFRLYATLLRNVFEQSKKLGAQERANRPNQVVESPDFGANLIKNAWLTMVEKAEAEIIGLAGELAANPRWTDALKGAPEDALERVQQEQEAGMPGERPNKKKTNTRSIAPAKRETTLRTSRSNSRAGDRHTSRKEEGLKLFGAHVEEELIEGIKKVARERDKSIQEVFREMLQKAIAEHEGPGALEKFTEQDIAEYAAKRRRALIPKP